MEQPSVDLAEVGKVGEELVHACAGKVVSHRPIGVIAGEAIAEAQAAIEGRKDDRVTIETGLPSFDRGATPIYPHEYFVMAGRSSHGKSSLMLQMAGHNLARNLRVVIFTLETSDKSVVKQIAAQRSGVDLRNIGRAMPEQQKRYLKGLDWLATGKNLLVFDKDLTADAIASRCRMLATTFRPDLVLVDYLGLVGGFDGSAYERASAASKTMIPLQKSLGCALGVGCQLNQGSEKDEREPNRTDFRDSGQILEDCHRAIAVWRKPGFKLDQATFDYDILQLKLRDGPLTKTPCRFHAPTTRFIEE